MSKFESLQFELKGQLSLDDREWKFTVNRLPSAQQLNEANLVKSIMLKTSGSEQRMTLKFNKHEASRATASFPLDKLLVISMASFKPPPGLRTQDLEGGNTRPSTSREHTEYIVRLLRSGVTLQGATYHFYGHSNSQLKSRTCFMLAAPKDQISRTIESLGNFSSMKTVAKKAKRIGLLFSTANTALNIDPHRCEDISDIETDGYVYTDGCGLMAPRFAQDVSRRMRLCFRDKRYTPSVFQIRYRGYKGVVTVDPRMREGPMWLRFRKSMKKFSGSEDLSFSVVEYSKPYSFGHLNDEVVLLLHALGVTTEAVLRKQKEHLHFLAQAVGAPRQAFRFLCYVGRYDLAERLLVDSIASLRPQIQALVHAEHAKMLNKRNEQRCRILIPQSRLLFGICDAWGVLKEGECAVKVTKDGDGLPYALKDTEVVVTRNPCLHPGDLQKFRVVDHPALAHLVDCIVFPTCGRRPSADMMSGGDLDGDKFFVCWDADLIPSTVSQPADYPGGKEPIKFGSITDDDRLLYFAKYTNASLGKVKNLYLDWARVKGPMAPECQELNRLFSQCVDGNIVKIPPRLEVLPIIAAPNAQKTFILDALHEAARDTISLGQFRDPTVNEADWDIMDLLLSRQDIAISEFEVCKLAARWCRVRELSLVDFLPYFDLNSLTSEEKQWVLSSLPKSSAHAAVVLNALCTSNIVCGDQLSDYKLNSPLLRWKRVYDSSCDRLATFQDTAAKTFEMFHRKLVVLQIDERLSVVIYIPKIIEKSRDCLVDDAIRVFAMPHNTNLLTSRRIWRPTKRNYRLFCDENVFQLFEGHRGNTWIFMRRGASNDYAYRNTANKGDRRRQRQATVDDGQNFDCRVSIALDKFSRDLQRHVGRVNGNGLLAAEIYVISNRDTKSMKSLDLWLQYIETESVLQLFDEDPKEYNLQTLGSISIDEVPPELQRLVREGPATIDEIKTEKGLRDALDWLRQYNSTGFVVSIYDRILAKLGNREGSMEQLSWQVDVLLDHISVSPVMAVRFAALETWGTSVARLESVLLKIKARGQEILKAIVLCSHVAEGLVVPAFEAALTKIDGLSLDSMADVIESCALSIRSTDLALDILLQCLKNESPRLLSGAGLNSAYTTHFITNMISVALDHISEAGDLAIMRNDLLSLHRAGKEQDNESIVECAFRVDASSPPEMRAHVRFTAASLPVNHASSQIMAKRSHIDALVVKTGQGSARFQCIHPLPVFWEQCSWQMTHCGSFVTAQTMMSALRTFSGGSERLCGVSRVLLELEGLAGRDGGEVEVASGSGTKDRASIADQQVETPKVTNAWSFDMTSLEQSLNKSQKDALHDALTQPVVLIWGPPGTGKTQTIVRIILGLVQKFPEERILVTAPTHNAVDNVMRRYLQIVGKQGPVALRVSTEVRKVAEDIRPYTLDAYAGTELQTSHIALREAKKRMKACQIAFTTCIGSGIGLLRKEEFGIVIVDEASQQTEPASLVPLVKGCQRAILVGDHIQLRPTVQPVTAALEYDVSLFERLYRRYEENSVKVRGLQTRMLDVQYRMHQSLCYFSSHEFYKGGLRTGVRWDERRLPPSAFPWPASNMEKLSDSVPEDLGRTVFIECDGREDLGQKSKRNLAQATLCRRICQLLLCESPLGTSGAAGTGDSVAARPAMMKQSIAVLTPYTAQRTLLKTAAVAGLNGDIDVFSVDGYQGREADIVIFVTVRCNERGDIGFLGDLRRLNVALTRARKGLIIIGSKSTLSATTGMSEEEGHTTRSAAATWRRLLHSFTEVKLSL